MRHILFTVILLLSVLTAGAASPSWEQARASESRELIDRNEDRQLDIRVKDGYLYITTNEEVTVKVFSILGQLISQQTIPVGTYRLHLPARGIYILKAGSVTRRITV